MIVAQWDGHIESVRIVPNDDGAYRIDSIPAGTHTIRYSTSNGMYPSAPRVSQSAEIELGAGEAVQHDFLLSLASIRLTLAGMRPGESGQLYIVPADSLETRITAEVNKALSRKASVAKMVRVDGAYRFDEIPAGNNAVYFGAYDSSKTKTADIYQTLRHTSALVYLEPGQTTEVSLRLR